MCVCVCVCVCVCIGVGEGTVSVTFSLQYGLDDGIMLITGSDRYKKL